MSSSISPLWRLKEAIRSDQNAAGRFDDAFAAFLGVNPTDTRCIDIVERHGKITAGRLAAEMGLTTGAVTAVIDRLETAGYVARDRDPGDRRKVWIALTAHTVELTHRIFGQFGDIGAMMVEGYSDAEIEAIVRFLSVSAALGNARARLLEIHLPGAVADACTRLDKARSFARAANAMTSRLRARAPRGQGMTPDMFEE